MVCIENLKNSESEKKNCEKKGKEEIFIVFFCIFSAKEMTWNAFCIDYL